MSHCAYKCHMIGGPWIAENPSCPVHGRDARDREDKVKRIVSSLEETLRDDLELGGPTIEMIMDKVREIVATATDY